MYCEKLLSITNFTLSKANTVDLSVIHCLDKFLKTETGIILPNKLNPIKFAIKHDVDDETAVTCFIIGAKIGLFKAIPYFYCDICNEMHDVDNLNSILHLDCDCDRELVPNNFRENIFLFFELLFCPKDCVFESNNNSDDKNDPLDVFLEVNDMGKQHVSLSMIDNMVGQDFADSIVRQRGKQMQQLLKGAHPLEFNL